MGPLYLSFIGAPFSPSAHEDHQNQGFTNLKSIPDEVVQISSGDNHVGFLTSIKLSLTYRNLKHQFSRIFPSLYDGR